MLHDGYSVSYGVTTSDQSGLPLTTHDGVPVEPPTSAGRALQLLLKRLLIDLPMTSIALLVLSPLLIGVALAVRFSGSGPAFVLHERVGLNGRTFWVRRFRTESDADRRPTRVGTWLRATGIDELPQLWNVLLGDMAMVGPHPVAPGVRAAGDTVPYSDYRYRVRPGLAGWAQINAPHGTADDIAAARQQIDHDCAYVQNFSLFLDVTIIFRTIVRESRAGLGF